VSDLFEQRLSSDRPQAPDHLVSEISNRIPNRRSTLTGPRRVAAIVFASVGMTVGVAGLAVAGNGGNGGSGQPAGCVESNGQAPVQNPNC
jgi:hypothetical protein